MAHTLRDLLIQRAARLQERPALTVPGWGTVSYAQLRNRVEGVALGLLATPGALPPSLFSATGTAWDWAAELAVAASGLTWDPSGWLIPEDVLGGPCFNADDGRGPYHRREQVVEAATPFHAGLTQGEVLRRLARLNHRLGWDHEAAVSLPLDRLGDPTLRAALWSALYGGSHAVLEAATPAARVGLLGRFRRPADRAWDPEPFIGFWD